MFFSSFFICTHVHRFPCICVFTCRIELNAARREGGGPKVRTWQPRALLSVIWEPVAVQKQRSRAAWRHSMRKGKAMQGHKQRVGPLWSTTASVARQHTASTTYIRKLRCAVARTVLAKQRDYVSTLPNTEAISK
eukprot:2851544-Amphidinium_carterae.1